MSYYKLHMLSSELLYSLNLYDSVSCSSLSLQTLVTVVPQHGTTVHSATALRLQQQLTNVHALLQLMLLT
jgi:hypothetical protein